MRYLWTASMVFLAGALASAIQNAPETALLFAIAGFGTMHAAESDIDWHLRIEGPAGLRALSRRRWKTTIVGKVAEWLAYLCMLALFVVHFR